MCLRRTLYVNVVLFLTCVSSRIVLAGDIMRFGGRIGRLAFAPHALHTTTTDDPTIDDDDDHEHIKRQEIVVVPFHQQATSTPSI